jgi:cell division protein FtsB
MANKEIQIAESQLARLIQELNAERGKLFNKGKPAYNMQKYKTDSVEYQRAKAAYDKAYPAFQAKETQLNAEITKLKTSLTTLKEQETTAKTNAGINKKIQDAETAVKVAKDLKDADRIKAAEDSLAALRNPEATPTGGESGDVLGVTGIDRYPNYTYQNDGSVVGKDGVRQYIVTLPTPNRRPGGPADTTQQPFDTPTKARDAFIKSYYGSDDKINQLKTQLLSSNWIKQSQLADGSWVKGLDDFIADYTAHVVREDKYGDAKDSISISDYLAQKKPAGPSSVKTYRTYSTRGEAKRMFDEYMINLLGAPGTAEQNNEFFDSLHQAENKAVSTVSNGTQTGSNLDDADRVLIAAKVAKKALKGTNIESILKSKTSSQAAVDIADLQKTAADYGIPLDAATALGYVAEGLGTKDYITKQKERLRLNAMQLYPTFKDHIAAGGTVKDITDVYAYARQKKLGVVIPNSTQDKKVMAAALAGKSISDYDREMQGEEEWGLTPEARNMGADFTQTILRAFGFGG